MSELDDVTGGYSIKVPYADPKYQSRPEKLESDLHEMLEKRENAIEYLLKEKRPDVFFGVVSVTDWAQHYFWRYHDPDHELYDPNVEEHRQMTLTRLWSRVDETVGMVADFADRENATLLVVSDHGFGPVNQTFFSNRWLEERGFRVSVKTSTVQSLRSKYFPYLRRIAEPVVSTIPQLNSLAKSVGKSIRSSPGDDVDWERSVAFAPRQNLTCGMIYMLSDDPDDAAAVTEALKNVTGEDGKPVEVDIYRPDELYHGPKTELAPDILFTIDGFECSVDPRYTTNDGYFASGPPSAARSGGHRMEGVYIASGPSIESGNSRPASIFDVAPTLLYAAGEPIPDVMDGEPLTDLFINSFREQRSTERRPLTELVTDNRTASNRDNEAVQDRLEDLGYI
jgi:predicted AlkP superfamily phosphohydrolase/phosphomutase